MAFQYNPGITLTYSFDRQVVSETVTLKTGEKVNQYITGVYGKIKAVDDVDGLTETLDTIFWTTHPLTKNKSDFKEFSDLSSVPKSAEDEAKRVIADKDVINMMADAIEYKTQKLWVDHSEHTKKDAPWA